MVGFWKKRILLLLKHIILVLIVPSGTSPWLLQCGVIIPWNTNVTSANGPINAGGY